MNNILDTILTTLVLIMLMVGILTALGITGLVFMVMNTCRHWSKPERPVKSAYLFTEPLRSQMRDKSERA